MILKTAELRTFFSISSAIKSNGILPILEYVKIDNDKIIKTNLTAFVSFDITPTGESMLLNENILYEMVKKTSADEITVEIKGNKVFLLDGKNKMFFALPDDAKLYPEFPNGDERTQEYRLNEDVLKAIGVALKNLGTTGDAFDFVHLAYDYVFGSDHFRFYMRKFDELPTVSLSPLAAGIISQFGAANYYEKGNFSFFSIGKILYGFAKQEVTPPDFTQFIQYTTKEPFVEIDTEEVILFIELLTASTKSNDVTCDFKKNNLSFHDAAVEVGNDIDLTTTGTYELEKSFLPRLMLPFFRSLGKDFLRISPMSGDRKGVTVWNEDDESMICMLAEVTMNPTN